MSKIKLLILSLFSFYLSACVTNRLSDYQYKVGYIGGGVDGLIYSNYLNSYLKSLNMFSSESAFSIDTSINHKQKVFITNVNNTSDREMVTSTIVAKVNDNNQGCNVLEYKDEVQQYYVIASNINFTSNTKALESIKKNNAEILTKQMVYYLSTIKNFDCINE